MVRTLSTQSSCKGELEMNEHLLNKYKRKFIQYKSLEFAKELMTKNKIYHGKHLHDVILKTVKFTMLEQTKILKYQLRSK